MYHCILKRMFSEKVFVSKDYMIRYNWKKKANKKEKKKKT